MLKQTLENDLPNVSQLTSPDWNPTRCPMLQWEWPSTPHSGVRSTYVRSTLISIYTRLPQHEHCGGHEETEFFTGGLEEGSSHGSVQALSRNGARSCTQEQGAVAAWAGVGQALIGTTCVHTWGKGTHSWGARGEGETREIHQFQWEEQPLWGMR